LGSSRLCTVYLVSLVLFISYIIIIQAELLVFWVEAQQEQSNNTTTATDLAKMRNNTIIPQAQDINESNLELIKICTASPNLECDNNMINIHNDCIAYPEYVATQIPSCDDSRLISYMIARGLLE
jgi:sensor c-di-GMP phosphodiesterase-like protein